LVFGYRKAMPAMWTHPLASIKPENQSVSSIYQDPGANLEFWNDF